MARIPNTLALPCDAQRVFEVSDDAAVQRALQEARDLDLQPLPLGSGSNVVLPGELSRAVLRSTNLQCDVLEDANDRVVLRVGAGVDWHSLVVRTVSDGLFGFENLALIPGLVGAAPVQNIGAYGAELSDFVIAVHGVDTSDGCARSIERDSCSFAYRDSVFKHTLRDRFIITAVDFQLSRVPTINTRYPALASALEERCREPGPVDVMNAVIDLRTQRLPDPVSTPNAGSFFKNPILDMDRARELVAQEPSVPLWSQGPAQGKLSAAALIEASGLRGYRDGAAGMSEKHALVMVNHGGATQEDILRVANTVKDEVRKRFAVSLEIEPRVYGHG